VANERSRQLQDLAQRVADALPLEVAEEVVLTGSVSRGVADAVSDIEMLIVTPRGARYLGRAGHIDTARFRRP
jgi:predicted nucleotidyltransferase